jgi:hypothetical protein
MADNRITSVMGKEAAEGGSNLDLPMVAAKGFGSWKDTEAVTPESSAGDGVNAGSPQVEVQGGKEVCP